MRKKCHLDLNFLEKLTKVRKDYGVRRAKKSNDTNRRRITKLVLDTFLRYHSLQHSASVNDFQVCATAIELGTYQRLKDLNLICKERTDEEIRLETGSRFKNKNEAKKYALKLGCEQMVGENPEDIAQCGEVLDKIMIILKGGKYDTGQSEEFSQPIQRKINNIGDVGGVARL